MLFELHGHVPRQREGHDSDVLLEITPVTQSDDVHDGRRPHPAEGRRQSCTGSCTSRLPPRGFGMTLSEACQNIVEHAGHGGWVAVQTYSLRKRLGRRVVVIAVCDAGIGFRQSLESAPGHARDRSLGRCNGARGSAVLRAVSRFRHGDAGRGQGLAGIRRYRRPLGRQAYRAQRHRAHCDRAAWDEDEPMREGAPGVSRCTDADHDPRAHRPAIPRQPPAPAARRTRPMMHHHRCQYGAAWYGVRAVLQPRHAAHGRRRAHGDRARCWPSRRSARRHHDRFLAGEPARLLLRRRNRREAAAAAFDADDGPIATCCFRGIREDHLDPIETCSSTIASPSSRGREGWPELFGCVDADERRHWDAVRDDGPVWAPSVASTPRQQRCRRRIAARHGCGAAGCSCVRTMDSSCRAGATGVAA